MTVGTNVKIRVARSAFRKFSPLQNSIWSQETYKIQEIDASSYPYLYKVSNLKKKYYDFQLLPLSNYFPIDDHIERPQILVNDYKLTATRSLRSGRETLNDADISYSILRNGKTENVSKSDLEYFKNLFGEKSLAYSSFFKDKKHAKFIV